VTSSAPAAVGTTYTPVTLASPTVTAAEHWDGRRWSLVPTWNTDPTDLDSLAGVSCTRYRCVAVGGIGYRMPLPDGGSNAVFAPLLQTQ
jgi:hypothetical protein